MVGEVELEQEACQEVARPTLRMPDPRQGFSRVRMSDSFPYPKNETTNDNVCTVSQRRGHRRHNLEAPGMAHYNFNKGLLNTYFCNCPPLIELSSGGQVAAEIQGGGLFT